MRFTDLLVVTTATAWGFLAIAGTDLLTALAVRRVPGYPVQAQIVFYVGLPFLSLMALLGASVLSRKARWFRRAYPFVVGLFALAFLPTLFLWGGGV